MAEKGLVVEPAAPENKRRWAPDDINMLRDLDRKLFSEPGTPKQLPFSALPLAAFPPHTHPCPTPTTVPCLTKPNAPASLLGLLYSCSGQRKYLLYLLRPRGAMLPPAATFYFHTGQVALVRPMCTLLPGYF